MTPLLLKSKVNFFSFFVLINMVLCTDIFIDIKEACVSYLIAAGTKYLTATSKGGEVYFHNLWRFHPIVGSEATGRACLRSNSLWPGRQKGQRIQGVRRDVYLSKPALLTSSHQALSPYLHPTVNLSMD